MAIIFFTLENYNEKNSSDAMDGRIIASTHFSYLIFDYREASSFLWL